MQRPLFQSDSLVLELHKRPIIKGDSFGSLKCNLSSCSKSDFVAAFLSIKSSARHLQRITQVSRIAFASICDHTFRLYPLYGVSKIWSPVENSNHPFHPTAPCGYVVSHNGPKMKGERLDEIQRKILSGKSNTVKDTTFYGDRHNNNLFAKLIRGELEQWRIWESSSHVAFLTPFPNTPGCAVVVPRRHLSSDIFSLSTTDFQALVEAIYEVLLVLRKGLDCPRVGLVFEGMEIDFAHAKFFPMSIEDSDSISQSQASYHADYCGFVTTQDGPELSPETLADIYQSLSIKSEQQ